MINPREVIQAYLKKVFSDLHSAIVGIIVGAIILIIGSIYLFAKNLWIALINTIQSPTPLWATVILVFVVLAYIYLKTIKNHLLSDSPESKPDYIIKQFPIGKYKWEAKIYENNYFEVDEYPLCITHDLRFIFGSNEKYCPHIENSKRCNSSLNKYDEFATYEAAKSIIEKKIRNKDY